MKKVLAIDIGGTYIKYGLIDQNMNITNHGKVPTPHDSKESVLEMLKSIYEKYSDVKGIAISAPGLIDVDKGVMRTSGAITCLEGMPLADQLSKLCHHIPVSIENDGKAAALCESTIGAAKDCDNSVALIFGTGIGGGVVIDNKILRGNNLIAGEFSAILTSYKQGSTNLAQEMSTISIVHKVKEALQQDSMSGEKMIQLYKNQEKTVVTILDEWFQSIAKFCYNLDCLYNPDCICIGGGISEEPLFVDKIQENIDQLFDTIFAFRKPVIKKCKYQNHSNLIGAYCTYQSKYGKEI